MCIYALYIYIYSIQDALFIKRKKKLFSLYLEKQLNGAKSCRYDCKEQNACLKELCIVN